MALEIATILPEFKTTSALKLVFLTPQKDLLNDEGLPTRLDTNATQKRRHFFLSDSASIPTEDCNLKHASMVCHTHSQELLQSPLLASDFIMRCDTNALSPSLFHFPLQP